MSNPDLSIKTLMALRERIPSARNSDRARLARELDRLFARRVPGADFESRVAALTKNIETSAAQVQRLRELPLRLDFDAGLPITAHREEIARALQKHQVIVVCGATGSGKTTQLPKICLEAGRGTFGFIGHTQPRRIAARAIAQRLAEEINTNVGGAVGYQVRFNDRTGPDCRVKLMTDGILLRELENDRLLLRYDTLIIDEAHERSLNIDFLLGVLKRTLPQRPDLRVIITSATIDPQRFADFFGGAPVIEVSGRSYPVEVRYRPLIVEEDDSVLSLPEGIVEAVGELDREDRGDVLVFLPGEKQIREAADALEKAKLMGTEVLPLYARLSTRDQEKIFERHNARRVVLATNVAETSLTVPGIRHVIDSGLARISRYSVRGKVQRLPIEPISQASADQRKGRSGRESPGICIRLFAEDEFNIRPPFTSPEVLRTNLASVILQMAALRLGEPQDFPFLDPPDTRQINDGYRLLQELKAVDADRKVTSLGKQLASLPLDPRLARMLIAASHHKCVSEMLVIAAFLSTQDPRERPSDAQQQADQQHATFADSRSDFLTVLNLWRAWQQKSEELSGSQLRKWCREYFLAFMRMREWQDLHRQLSDTVEELELKSNTAPAEYADLHQAILTGFLGNIGTVDEKREYEGARGSRFVIAPGTPLAARPPKWVVAASLMETTRLYARMVAAVETQWIAAAGEHLLKRTYSEPHWVDERGFVAASETVSLYGLTLSAGRRVNYGNVAPKEAQEIFVREALVEGRSRLRAAFLDHNRRAKKEVERIEAKLRRRDVLIDEQTMVDFYRSRLPETINSVAAMERWLKEADHSTKTNLSASRRDLMTREVPEVTAHSHPDVIEIAGNRLPLEYRFEPSAEDDGVTVVVPAPVLPAVEPAHVSWIVAGWRVELITESLRELPKAIRKAFVPVPEYAARAMTQIADAPDFNAAFAEWIRRESGAQVDATQLAALPIPKWLRFNIRVLGSDGRVVAEGRDLGALKRTARQAITGSAPHAAGSHFRSWDFGELPEQRTVERRGLRYTVYPTAQDRNDGIALAEESSLWQAEAHLRFAVLRLAILALPEQWKLARRTFADQKELVLLGQGLSSAPPLADRLAEKTFEECFLPDGTELPRSRAGFQALLDQHRGRFGEHLDRVRKHAIEVLQQYRDIKHKVAALPAGGFAALRADVEKQLETLVPPSFPRGVPGLLWTHLPRYLKTIARRVDKAPGNAKRDQELAARVFPSLRAFSQLHAVRDQTIPHPELDRLQWMIEELRVSLFAQDLKTAIPVSEKRVSEQVEKVQRERAA
ncbi:MAG TPA: ATP-dependent RNA helicase HrpA [Steroidobacteraceae bacterium]|nr:ATP-dependent RNA helicase HrpA [Steroidobacteraceae bacterium]